jgi:hypothetical protein
MRPAAYPWSFPEDMVLRPPAGRNLATKSSKTTKEAVFCGLCAFCGKHKFPAPILPMSEPSANKHRTFFSIHQRAFCGYHKDLATASQHKVALQEKTMAANHLISLCRLHQMCIMH